MTNKTSVITLMSYDSEYLIPSISSYYNYVDEIVIGLDKDRISWNKNPFTFDEEFIFNELSNLDGDNKINIVEDDFHSKYDKPIDNDNHERNILKTHCSNDIIVSIDADEELLNAKEFFYSYLPIAKDYINTYDICMTWVTPFKEIDNETLLIANDDGSPFFGENQGFITNKNSTFTYARWTNKSAGGANRIQSPLLTLHWSMCRPQKELEFKINNTGHADIVKRDPFFELWKSVTLDNYTQYKNFRTSKLGPAQWPSLVKVPNSDLREYILAHSHLAY